MSLISRIKSYLPVSSRTFHARIDELYARIEMMDRGVNGSINHKFDVVLADVRSISTGKCDSCALCGQ